MKCPQIIRDVVAYVSDESVSPDLQIAVDKVGHDVLWSPALKLTSWLQRRAQGGRRKPLLFRGSTIARANMQAFIQSVPPLSEFFGVGERFLDFKQGVAPEVITAIEKYVSENLVLSRSERVVHIPFQEEEGGTG